jgi:CRP-like cAMP-binding protein
MSIPAPVDRETREPRPEDGGTLADWRDHPIFEGLTATEADSLGLVLRTVTYDPGAYILHEGEAGDRLFFIASGTVDVLKRDPYGQSEHTIGRMGAGDVVGEVSFFDHAPRSASIRARTATTMVALDYDQLLPRPSGRAAPERPEEMRLVAARSRVVFNLGRTLSERVREGGERAAHAARARLAMGHFIVGALGLMALYTWTLGLLPLLADALPKGHTSYVTVPLQAIFCAVCLRFMRKSGYPLEYFAITTRGWRRATREGVLLTLPLIAAATLCKWIWISTIAPSAGPVIAAGRLLRERGATSFFGFLAVYALMCVAQELIARGALQSSLMRFLDDAPRGRLKANLIPSLLFAMTHLHISVAFSMLVFFPGLYWGWMFSRHRNLFGVTTSHVLVGCYWFFVLA